VKKTTLSTLTMFALLTTPVLLLAHHGTAGTYDQSKVVPVAGVVKEFRWRNPHCVLVLASKDASGNEVTYSFEIGSPNSLVKGGFSRDTFKVGDTVSLNMRPAFGNPYIGSPAGRKYVINGKEVTGIAGGDL
jgi:hypothetical protein